jgi:hypothetical protein
MCACKETDVRESVNDCTLTSGKGHISCGETCHPFYDKKLISSFVVQPVSGFGGGDTGLLQLDAM